MSDIDEMLAWLKRQLDADEASEWPHRPSCQMVKQPGLSCNCDAADRWRREVEAKRLMLAELEQLPHYAWDGRGEYGCPKYTDPEAWRDLYGEGVEQVCNCGRDAHVERQRRLLALPFADRPGYREEEWRP